jgi:hypothetical protein
MQTILIKITSNIAKLIHELAPRDGIDASNQLQDFFAQLSIKQPENPAMSETELSQLIKSNDK